MPKVRFIMDNRTVEVAKGTPLAEVVDEVGASVPFGCREGQCGTCMLIVHEGLESFQPMGENERETLRMNDAGPRNRLCCQAIVMGDMAVEPI